MDNKVQWNKKKLIYKLDDNENPLKTNFFLFYKNGKKILNNFLIRIIDEKEVEIEGNFSEEYTLKVNNINYLFNEDLDKNENSENKNSAGVKKEIKEIEFEEDFYEIDKKYKITLNDDIILIENLEKNIKLSINNSGIKINKEIKPFQIIVEQYTNEIYPDFPYKKTKLNVENKYEIKRKTNVIYKIKIGDTYYIVKEVPRFYWSNIKDLKEFLKDTSLEFSNKTDEQFKKLIQEKSVYLKRRFGLNKSSIEDIEYFPLYKKLVNLYCLYDIISLSFINGVNSDLNNGSINSAGSNLKLGNFSTGVDGGANGSILSTQLVKNMIDIAEKDLYASLYKKHGIAYRKNLEQRGGVFCAEQIFFKI